MSEVSRKTNRIAACPHPSPALFGDRPATAQQLDPLRCARRWMPTFLLLLIPGLVGCSPWQLARRTLYGELAEFPRVTDGRISCQQYQRWAKLEWKKIVEQNTGEPFSSDYASGFIQGFVDMVYAGGEVRTPAVPARRYWGIGYKNSEGKRATENWFNGFDHGARVAKENGYRERAVIPSSIYMDAAKKDESQTLEWDGSQLLEPSSESVRSDTTGHSSEPTPAQPSSETPNVAPPADPEPIPTPSNLPFGSAQAIPLPQTTPTDLAVVPSGVTAQRPTQHHREAETDSALNDASTQVTEPEALSVEPVVGAAASELEMPAETLSEGPPAPPWRTHSSASSAGASSDPQVTPASFNQPVATNSPTVSSTDASFDPFQGTRFSGLSEASGSSNAPVAGDGDADGEARTLRSGPPVPPARRRAQPTSTEAATSTEADGASLTASGLQVRPLQLSSELIEPTKVELAVAGPPVGIQPLYEMPSESPVANSSFELTPIDASLIAGPSEAGEPHAEPSSSEAPSQLTLLPPSNAGSVVERIEASGHDTTANDASAVEDSAGGITTSESASNDDTNSGWQATPPSISDAQWKSVR